MQTAMELSLYGLPHPVHVVPGQSRGGVWSSLPVLCCSLVCLVSGVPWWHHMPAPATPSPVLSLEDRAACLVVREAVTIPQLRDVK